jgi:hypothetical protein
VETDEERLSSLQVLQQGIGIYGGDKPIAYENKKELDTQLSLNIQLYDNEIYDRA